MQRRGTMAVLLAAVAVVALAGAGASSAAAARASCPGQNDAGASAGSQERAMLCLVNRAREQRGLDPLAAPASLARAAGRKSADILRCDEFSHEACGREFTYWFDRVGYRGCREGENIAYGGGDYAPPPSSSRCGCAPPAIAGTSLAPTRTSASASRWAGSKATAVPTSGPSSSAAAVASRRV